MAKDSDVSSDREWKEGDVLLGLYEVRKLIARGGMGNVYLVHHRGWDLDIAVKCPKASIAASERGAKLFEHECETWVNLGLHPNVATCYYVRRIGGVPSVFAEYIDGGTLSKWIYQRILYQDEEPLARLLDVAIQFAWGLSHAHAQGLLHQDVKPLNVLMGKDGTAKVTDFGLSRALSMATDEGEGVKPRRGIGSRGTPAYCSPEQAYRRPLTLATDIWSWAVSVLEMFVGDVTWMAGQSAGHALEGYLVLGPDYDRIPEMPEPLVDLLRACFQEDPADRPPTMTSIIDRLRSVYRDALRRDYPRPTPEAAETTAERLNNRAVSFLDLGKKEEARHIWEEAGRISPGHPESTYNYTLHSWREGLTTDITVLRSAKRVRRKNPKSWKATFMLAEIQAERGAYREALKLLQELDVQHLDGHEAGMAYQEVSQRLPESRCLAAQFGPHGSPVTALGLSWDGRVALSADTSRDSGASHLHVWQVGSGERTHTLEGHRDKITSVALNADGVHAASGSRDATARIWSLATGQCLHTLKGHDGPVKAVRFVEDGRALLTAGVDGAIHMWDFARGLRTVEYLGHAGAVNALCPGVPGRSFFSASEDHTLRQWDTHTGRCLSVQEGYESPVISLALSGDRRYILAGTADGYIELYDVSESRRHGRRRAHSEPVASVCMSKRGEFGLSAVRGGKIRLWEMAANRCLHTFPGCAPLALSGDGLMALSAGLDNRLCLWVVSCQSPVLRAPLMLCRAH